MVYKRPFFRYGHEKDLVWQSSFCGCLCHNWEDDRKTQGQYYKEIIKVVDFQNGTVILGFSNRSMIDDFFPGA